MGHRRCDICGQPLPTGCRLYCPSCREEFWPLYRRLYGRIVDDKREPRQDKIEEMRAKYARIMQEEETPVTNKELALWLAQGNGQIYHHDDSGFRTEVKTIYIYHQDEDNCDCTVNQYLQCKIRKWGDTEWVTPTREYMGLEE